ncbi:MAG: hypothetical protein HHJ12_00365 [Glaciimonas sp.]|nr:hypothetical protein [Glaciimonas sp.]
MKKVLVNISLCFAALSFATVAAAATDAEKATYKSAKDSATATYKTARTQCDTMKGNPKDVCIEEAKAAEKRSKAEAEAQYKNTPKAHMNARLAGADADYAVAKEKCNAQSGNGKDVCVKEAKAVHTKALVDAKSSQKISDVKSDAKADKSDADYNVAIEKCTPLAGPAKEACVASAKSKYGK